MAAPERHLCHVYRRDMKWINSKLVYSSYLLLEVPAFTYCNASLYVLRPKSQCSTINLSVQITVGIQLAGFFSHTNRSASNAYI
jgi:hypothetical protein